MSRAVVLDALSGRQDPRRAPRVLLLALLAIAAVAALFVYWRLDTPSRPRDSASTSSGSIETRTAARPIVRPPVATAKPPDAARSPAPADRQPAVVPPSTSMSPTEKPGVSALPRTDAAGSGRAARGDRNERRAEAVAGAHAPDDNRLARALQYQKAGEIDRAAAEYRAILEADDTNAQAHNNVGLLYRARGLNEAAMREFRRAIAIDPSYDTARNNLGVACLGAGDLDAAGAEFRRILASDPRNQEAMVNLALVQRAGGRLDEARETLLQALALNERNAAAHYNLALLYEEAQEVTRALDHYDAYLKYASGADAARVPAVREHCQVLRQRLPR